MYSLLLGIIYLSFVSLGLPDPLLGAGWPVMRIDLGVDLSYAGIISTIIAAGTIISSLFSDYLTKKLKPGLVTAVSVSATAIALFGFSSTDSFIALCFWAIPYGLGAGAVDAALNNYIALHYSSRHMSWLHAFWGVGVTISPYIMSFCLSRNLGWHTGYRGVAILQIILTAILFSTLSLWKQQDESEKEASSQPVPIKSAVQIKGVKYCLIAFFCFCAFEATSGLWASSYLVEIKGYSPDIAAGSVTFIFLGVTLGRFSNGFAADKFGDRTMIKIGNYIMIIGVIMLFIPFKSDFLILSALFIIGFGTAPVYPCIIHSTPINFGKENSQALIGIQMASAYTGTTLAPPVFGMIAQHFSLTLYPYYLIILALLLLFMTNKMYNVLNSNEV